MSDALLPIRVKPRSSRTTIGGNRAGRLLIEVTAPPVDGQANEAACKLLAKALGLARKRVTVVSGKQSRDKVVRIEDMSLADVEARLGGPAESRTHPAESRTRPAESRMPNPRK